MEKETIIVWDGGDETQPPMNSMIVCLTTNPNLPTPETEAEEL